MTLRAFTVVSRVISFLSLSKNSGKAIASCDCSKSAIFANKCPLQEDLLSHREKRYTNIENNTSIY